MRVRAALIGTCVLSSIGFMLGTDKASARARPLRVDGVVDQLAASPDGEWLAAVLRDGSAVLLHVGDRTPEESSEPSETASGAKDAPDDPAADTGGASDAEQAPVPPAALPPERRSLPDVGSGADAMVFTPDSRYLVIQPDLEDDKAKVVVISTATASVEFEIDCAGDNPEKGVGEKHVWKVVAGPGPSEFLVLRNDKLLQWDASTQKETVSPAWCPDDDPSSLLLSGDVFVLSSARATATVYSRSSSKVLTVIDESALIPVWKPTNSGKKWVMEPSARPCAVDDSASVVVLKCNQSNYTNMSALNDPKDVRKAIDSVKRAVWLQGFDAVSGKSLWVERFKKNRPYRVTYVGDRLAMRIGKKMRVYDMRKGKPRLTVSVPGSAVTAFASCDGVTWWYSDDKGRIRKKR